MAIYYKYSTYISHSVLHSFDVTILHQASTKFSTDRPRRNGLWQMKNHVQIILTLSNLVAGILASFTGLVLGERRLQYDIVPTDHTHSDPDFGGHCPQLPPHPLSKCSHCMLCSRVEVNIWPSSWHLRYMPPSHTEGK